MLQTTINLIERSNALKDIITLKDPIVLQYDVLQTPSYLIERSNDRKDILKSKDPIVLHKPHTHHTLQKSL